MMVYSRLQSTSNIAWVAIGHALASLAVKGILTTELLEGLL